MNGIERRIRNAVNPYSTAFAGWWCHSARYLPLIRIISGTGGAPPPRVRRAVRHVQAEKMAARRAAVDASLASRRQADS